MALREACEGLAVEIPASSHQNQRPQQILPPPAPVFLAPTLNSHSLGCIEFAHVTGFIQASLSKESLAAGFLPSPNPIPPYQDSQRWTLQIAITRVVLSRPGAAGSYHCHHNIRGRERRFQESCWPGEQSRRCV